MLDTEVKCFEEIEKLHKFLADRDCSDKWIYDYINENKIIGVANVPILTSLARQNIPYLECTDEELQIAMQESGLLFSCPKPDYSGRMTVPLRYTAYESLFDRIGLYGPIIRNSEDSSQRKALEPEVKAEWLTQAISHCKGKCKILYRDGKVSTVRSEGYEILSAEQLLQLLELQMAESWDSYTFMDAKINHEYAIVRYSVDSENFENMILKKLLDIGIVVSRSKLIIKFVTSDTGNASALLYPYLLIDDMEVSLGSEIGMKHYCGSSLEKWQEKILPLLGSFTKLTVNIIDSLGNIKIKNPAGCFRRLAKELKLPKKAAMNTAEEIEASYMTATALDLYFMLFVCIEDMSDNKNCGQILDYQEQAARALFIKWDELDYPFEWAN